MATLRLTGEPVTLERLSGAGGPGVILITGPQGRAVIKYPVRQEALFYRKLAPMIRQQGLGLPEVYAQSEASRGEWILMEALSSTLEPPYQSKLADMTTYLAKLHTISSENAPMGTEDLLSVRPVLLSYQDIEDACTLWPTDTRGHLLHLLQLPWPSLPDERRLVSGDPNPTNWGFRASGQLVLFDWSEVAFSHPAYDLGVLCGGLPEVALVRDVVNLYLASPDVHPGQSRDEWVAWVITARLVAFVWFAAWWKRGQLTEAARPGLAMLQKGLCDWLDRVRPVLIAFLP